jgi:outer membrane protein OmpA-like peptidoglycan-associated protein
VSLRRLVFCTVAAWLGLAADALAQDGSRAIDLQLYQPPANVGATLTIDRPEVPRHLTLVFGLALDFANEPLVRYRGEAREPVVLWAGQAQVMAALGLFEWIELGVIVPVGLNQPTTSDLFARTLAFGDVAGGLGDLRLSFKLPLLRGDFGLSARVVVSLPTSGGQSFLGSDHWTLYPSLVAAGTAGPLRVAGELGYRMRQRRALADFEQDDEVHLAAGLSVELLPELLAIGEVQSRIGLGGRSPFGGSALGTPELPVEADLGLRVRPGEGLTIEAAGGFGLVAGSGAPAPRVLATLRYATEREPCPWGPEDDDGFEDGDFCRDDDNDGDGLEDEVDRCPNDAEDPDGFRDEDGCPDADNDADGVPDADDACPTQSEDDDEFASEDGCPEPDNDEDGVPDGADACVMDPEDLDSFEDEDGCPEPGPRSAPITVSDTRILIPETIYFEFDTDVIRSVSTPLLDQLAGVINALDRRVRVRIEGHTDDVGGREYNLDLSYRRARAVMEYLIGRGVPRARLEYHGYGDTRPQAPNDDPASRALNRRVEFTILR